MAVYKLYPDKDAFLLTENVTANTGLDEIVEIGGYPNLGIGQTSRTLIKFDTQKIGQIITENNVNKFSASLKLNLADTYETPTTHSVFCYPVYQSWDEGIGKFGDNPIDTSGVSWKYTKSGETTLWDLPANSTVLPTGVTGSHNDTYVGGGNWYTELGGVNLESEQSFKTKDNLDIDLDVTTQIEYFLDGTLTNNGFILKLDDSLEFSTDRVFMIKYFSSDTNTIFPPELQIKWDDSDYQETGTLLDSPEVVIEVSNNVGEYKDDGKYRFRLHTRPRFPTRQFSTTSIYKTNYRLPENSYYAIKDEHTEEMIIDFDTTFTKISNDTNGPYFDLYMNGLQPERFYRILVKTEIDGNTVTLSDKSTFKVVRNV